MFGETDSHVNAHIEGGILTASIVTKEDSYHVEVLFLMFVACSVLINVCF